MADTPLFVISEQDPAGDSFAKTEHVVSFPITLPSGEKHYWLTIEGMEIPNGVKRDFEIPDTVKMDIIDIAPDQSLPGREGRYGPHRENPVYASRPLEQTLKAEKSSIIAPFELPISADLVSVLGFKGSLSRQKFSEVVSNSDKRILQIYGHGGGRSWRIGEAYGKDMPTREFLIGLPDVLRVKAGIDKFNNLGERYSAILLTSCSDEDTDLSAMKQTAEELGVPVFFNKGHTNTEHVRKGKTVPQVVMP